MFPGAYFGKTFFPEEYFPAGTGGGLVVRFVSKCIDLPYRPLTLDLPQRPTTLDLER